MASTYEPIASASLSAASQVEFTSLGSGYTDLVIVYHLTNSSGNQNLALQFNSDTGTNYSQTFLAGTGSSAVSGRYSNLTGVIVDVYSYASSTNRAVGLLQFMSYANTNVFKTVLSATASAANGVERSVALWRSTSAITSIKLFPGGGTITGAVDLYGIKAA